MTSADELIVREYLTNKVLSAIVYDFAVPAPIYYAGKEDWLTGAAQSVTDFDTAHEIDFARVECAWLYIKTFADDPDSSPHAPLTTFTYELYLFTENDSERGDEDLMTPDAFDARTLKRHNEFVESLINLKAEFQGEINFPGLSGYTTNETLPLTIREEVQNNTECEFVKGVKGTSVRLGIPVRLQMEAC